MHLVALCCIALLFSGCGQSYEFKGTAYDPPEAAAEIQGEIGNGQSFRLSDLKGDVVVIFFGYTNCPDVCPLTLAEISKVYKQLGAETADLKTVFVSIDPERDGPEKLDAYVHAFNPGFYGVYVAPDALEQVKADYYVVADKEETGNPDDDNYFMAHTGWLYLIDRQGRLRVLHSAESSAEDLAADINYLLTN
ncbi:MAG: SCO family protein [Caldilineaceae bacterium]|nr:SCO family protein [Caldilineaceae bacterium]